SLQKSGGTSPVASIPHDSPGVRPANPPAGSSPQRRPKTFAPAMRYPLTARTRNTQANNNFRLPDIDTSTPADHHILTSLRPPNPFPAVQPGGITPVNDAVRRAQSKQFAVPNAIPGSVFTPDSQHQETPSSPEP